MTTPYNRAHHAFAVCLACATFLLLIAGALVTSNDAGLSVPDWPTSFGSLYKIPHLVGGVKYEHTHRMIAQFIGLLTIILAVWTWRSDHRRWMKYLSGAALLMVIAQGVLGGLTVLYYLPPAISSAHAALAQTFFCTAIAMAIFTSRTWTNVGTDAFVRPPSASSAADPETRRPHLFTLAALSILILYVQLFLGAMFRHHGMGWLPHVLNAPLVAAILTWTAVAALIRYPKITAIRAPAITMLSLLIVQLGLGFLAFLTRVEWGKNAAQPEFPMVISTVAHVAAGALLLATAVVLAIQVWHHVPATAEEPIPTAKPIAA
jgi:cytochrome c oxidase assembly protein subunit 15